MKKLTREEIIIELDQYYEAAGFKGIKYRELEDMNQIELERLYKETLAVDDTEILGEETIRKYNVDVKKENFEKRCNLLIDSIMKHEYCESRPNTKDIIANKLDFQSGSKSYEFAYLVIGDTYVPNEYEDNFYSGWLFGYIRFVISNSNIEEIILECDGFFSYLAIQEILEILEDMAEKNSELERYINDSSFLELKLNIGKILGVLSVEEEDYFDIGIMGKENKRLTDWMRIDGMYFIEYLLEEVSNNLLRIDGCKILSKDLQELSESIIPENTLKNEDVEDKSSESTKNQIRIDFPQALLVLAEARTKEMMKLNEMFESAGERIKDIIESGEELSDEEKRIKNNIIRTMNREQALGEMLSIYYGEDIIDNNIRRMPTYIVFSTLEEWIENPSYMEEGQASEEEVRENNIFCERLTMSIKLVLNRIKSTMEGDGY